MKTERCPPIPHLLDDGFVRLFYSVVFLALTGALVAMMSHYWPVVYGSVCQNCVAETG